MSSISAFCTTGLLLLTLSCQTGSLLIVVPTELTGEAPGTARIECHYNTCPGQAWHGPALEGTASHYRIEYPDSLVSTLTIDPLTEDDEGEYYCSCADNQMAGPSYLTVNHAPSLRHVDLNQTIYRGRTGSVYCDADRGDPPRELIWVRNGSRVLSEDQQIRISSDRRRLIIENTMKSNEGLYECVVITTNGPLKANIIVNVIDPPQNVLINPDLPFNVSIEYGQQLHLDCRNPSAEDNNARFSWLNHINEEISSSNLLDVASDNIVPGLYRCSASVPGGREQHTVIVTLMNAPPRCTDSENHVLTISAMEQESFILRKELRFQLDRENTNITWKKSRFGEMVDYDFGPRFNYSISEKILRFHIKRADLTDQGHYQVNISNPYGDTTFEVNINVAKLRRTVVHVQIPGLSCNMLQEHEENYTSEIATAHACSVCGRVRVGDHNVSCGGDTDILTVTLLSQDELPEISQVTLTDPDSEETVDALVCRQDCSTTIAATTTITTSSSVQLKESYILAILVSVLLTVVVVILVLITFKIRRIRYCQCHKHRVGQEENGLEQQPAVHKDREPECIAYVSVNKPPSLVHGSVVDPTATPVTLPHVTQPPHVAPHPLPSHIAPTPPSSTTKAKRPNKLYIRSHSYHGSTRTPQA